MFRFVLCAVLAIWVTGARPTPYDKPRTGVEADRAPSTPQLKPKIGWNPENLERIIRSDPPLPPIYQPLVSWENPPDPAHMPCSLLDPYEDVTSLDRAEFQVELFKPDPTKYKKALATLKRFQEANREKQHSPSKEDGQEFRPILYTLLYPRTNADDHWKSIDDYISRLKYLADMGFPTIVYTTPYLAKRIKALRKGDEEWIVDTTYEDIWDVPTVQHRKSKEFQDRQTALWDEFEKNHGDTAPKSYRVAHLDAVYNSKFFFTWKTIMDDRLRSNQFMFVDAGLLTQLFRGSDDPLLAWSGMSRVDQKRNTEPDPDSDSNSDPVPVRGSKPDLNSDYDSDWDTERESDSELDSDSDPGPKPEQGPGSSSQPRKGQEIPKGVFIDPKQWKHFIDTVGDDGVVLQEYSMDHNSWTGRPGYDHTSWTNPKEQHLGRILLAQAWPSTALGGLNFAARVMHTVAMMDANKISSALEEFALPFAAMAYPRLVWTIPWDEPRAPFRSVQHYTPIQTAFSSLSGRLPPIRNPVKEVWSEKSTSMWELLSQKFARDMEKMPPGSSGGDSELGYEDRPRSATGIAASAEKAAAERFGGPEPRRGKGWEMESLANPIDTQKRYDDFWDMMSMTRIFKKLWPKEWKAYMKDQKRGLREAVRQRFKKEDWRRIREQVEVETAQRKAEKETTQS